MQNKFKTIIIIFMFILNIFLIYIVDKNKKQHTAATKKYAQLIQTKNILLNKMVVSKHLEELFRLNIKLKKNIINNNGIFQSCIDLSSDSLTVFFRYTNEACSKCIYDELERLKKTNGAKIICLYTDKNKNNLGLLPENNHFNYYYLPDKKSITGLKQEEVVPFIFFIQKKKLISLFIPIKELPALSEGIYKNYQLINK